MPFKEPFNTYYNDVYAPAIVEAGLKPVRADELFKPGPIMKDIWEHVVASHVMVAELTGRNPNVFYELGLAHAIGKPVVLLTQDPDDVPFDLQHLRMLQYNTVKPDWAATLRSTLTNALVHTMRDPMSALALPPLSGTDVVQRAEQHSQDQAVAPPQALSSSSDLSSQFALQLFSALPNKSKIDLMEIALEGRQPTTEEFMKLFIDAMKRTDESS